MAEERDQERTEPATPRRRREARERGQVARSSDLSSAAVLLAAVLGLLVAGSRLVDGLSQATSGVLGRLPEWDGARESLMPYVGRAFGPALLALVPIVLGVLAAGVAVNVLQVGFLFAADPLAPRLERLDPIAGLRRIFSARSTGRLVAGLLKLSAIVLVAVWTVWVERNRLSTLAGRPVEEIVRYDVGLLTALALRTGLVLGVLAVLDYGFQRWQFERDLRMSREEVREELRRFEGDPQIRDRRRAIQRRLATRRMVGEVRRAAVVLGDSDRLTVALEYRKDEMESPVVVAKGAGELDRRIRELALDHGVPVVERPDLARALYRRVEVGQSIPGDFYEAVAEVLAFAHRLKGSVVSDFKLQTSNF